MPPPSRISPPLPLPVGFTLLPSRSPGQHLTPLLYTVINGLPIYLTLLPSHTPHVSLLPLLLALKTSFTPLSLLVEFGLKPTECTLDVDGIAPWSDLWVPLPIARQIVKHLGASRLFWDEQGRGLLGRVEDAVSWEEADGWYHNWLPAKSHLPSSSYSLDTLLDRTWSFIEVIPEDRCVFTPAGKQRSAKLRSDAISSDHSRLRAGMWGPAWDALLGWTLQSWSEFRKTPSKLPGALTGKRRKRPQPVLDLLNAVPDLFGGSHASSIPLDASDVPMLLPHHNSTSLLGSATQLLMAICKATVTLAPPLTRLVPTQLLDDGTDPVHMQWHARVQLALCSLLSETVVRIWRLRRENDRLRAALASSSHQLPADIVISPRHGDAKPPSRPSSSSSSEELDVLVELERRRGGSPSAPRNSRRKRPPDSSRLSRRRANPTSTRKEQRQHQNPPVVAPIQSVDSATSSSEISQPRVGRSNRSSSPALGTGQSEEVSSSVRNPIPSIMPTPTHDATRKALAPTTPALRSAISSRSVNNGDRDAQGNGQQLFHQLPDGSTSEFDGDFKRPEAEPSPTPAKKVDVRHSDSDVDDRANQAQDEASVDHGGASEAEMSTDHHNDSEDSMTEMVVDSLVEKRRIHPLLTTIFSLCAVATAYFVIFVGGPSSSVYG